MWAKMNNTGQCCATEAATILANIKPGNPAFHEEFLALLLFFSASRMKTKPSPSPMIHTSAWAFKSR